MSDIIGLEVSTTSLPKSSPEKQTEVVSLSVAEYERLQRGYDKAKYLEAGGVDNWEWYSESLRPWYKKYFPEDFDDEDYE